MYKVICEFVDLQDDKHYYKIGATFPRRGLKVTNERLEELSTSANKRGKPLIQEVKRKKKE